MCGAKENSGGKKKIKIKIQEKKDRMGFDPMTSRLSPLQSHDLPLIYRSLFVIHVLLTISYITYILGNSVPHPSEIIFPSF